MAEAETETETLTTRRALLAASLGAAALTAVNAVGRATPARAADGNTIVIGTGNSADTGTFLGMGANGGGEPAFSVTSATYRAIEGFAINQTGGTAGVHGQTDSPAGAGINGYATGAGGFGAKGEATNTAGIGVYAKGPGLALKVDGKVKLSRSGRTTVTAGNSSKDVTVSGGLTSSNRILATMNGYRSGVYVAAAYVTNGKLRIRLNKAVASDVSVTWLVLE